MPTRTQPAVYLMLSLALAGALAGCVQRPTDAQMQDPQVQIREAHALVVRAQRADGEGDSARAMQLYQQALATYRDFPVAWNNLGVLLVERGENLQAVEAFRAAAELSPTDPRPVTSIGSIWQNLGYLDKAGEAYTEALNRDPSHLPALREAVMIDTIRGTINDRTARRVQQALLLEKDPQWALELKRRKLVIDQAIASGPESLGH